MRRPTCLPLVRWSIAGVALATVLPAHAQEVLFGSSPNPVGSGARALGIASAFIATADDGTAASWNPAGLISLETPEVSLVLDLKNRREIFDGVGVDESDRLQATTYPGLNYFSAAYPFKIDDRYFVASVNFQSLIDFEKNTRATQVYAFEGDITELAYDIRQNGRLMSVTPAIAFQLSPSIALGLSVNLWTDKLGYKNGWTERRELLMTQTMSGLSTIMTETLQRERFDFNGVGANLGVLWDVTPQWTVGAVFKTPTWGTAQKKTLEWQSQEYDSAGNPSGEPIVLKPQEFEEPMRWPLSYGLGVAYRHSDELTASIDAYRTEWGLFRRRNTDPNYETHEARNPISGEPYSTARVSGITQVHLGAEYLFILARTVIPVRGGLFYDPEPQTAKTNHFFGLGLGTGVSIGDTIVDAAYQFRFGPDADPNVVHPAKGFAGSVEGPKGGSVLQHLFYLSAIQHF